MWLSVNTRRPSSSGLETVALLHFPRGLSELFQAKVLICLISPNSSLFPAGPMMTRRVHRDVVIASRFGAAWPPDGPTRARRWQSPEEHPATAPTDDPGKVILWPEDRAVLPAATPP